MGDALLLSLFPYLSICHPFSQLKNNNGLKKIRLSFSGVRSLCWTATINDETEDLRQALCHVVPSHVEAADPRDTISATVGDSTRARRELVAPWKRTSHLPTFATMQPFHLYTIKMSSHYDQPRNCIKGNDWRNESRNERMNQWMNFFMCLHSAFLWNLFTADGMWLTHPLTWPGCPQPLILRTAIHSRGILIRVRLCVNHTQRDILVCQVWTAAKARYVTHPDTYSCSKL